ncbi:MAG: FtsX-like permease family protein [Pyrinomonadaceae bacterium]
MQRALLKKLLRDILHLRGQIIATALVVACGVASFVSMRSTYDSLLATQQDYYAQYRFGEIFVHLTRAPPAIRAELERIPGVAAIQTRIVAEAILDLPNLREPAQGRIVSIPERETAMLNDIHLVRGRYIAVGQPDEVIVSGAFADANAFNPGDGFAAIVNGRWRQLEIVGVGLSPEYIYEIRSGDVFPDNSRFGIIWMNERTVGAAFNMEGAFNDVSATLAPGASLDQVIENVDRILKEYGGTGAYGRTDQHSYRFISNEFAQLRTFGTFLPAIFLGVTAFLLHLVLSRLVNTQREQIGLLKAFGYTNYEVGLHFLGLAFAAVFGGIVLGIVLGYWMGDGMTTMYADYFRFPILAFRTGWWLVIYSILITVGAATVGAGSAVRRAVMLPPAEAMRPEAPAAFKPGLLVTIGLSKYLSPAHRIVIRNLSRQPIKAMLAVFGISAAAALLFTGFYFYDAINRIVEVQFEQAIREDAVITFNRPRPQQARLDLAAMPGVLSVEAFRGVAARLTSEHRSRRVGLTGAEPAATLHRIVDQDSIVFHVPPDGIVLSAALADALSVSVGDRLTVEVLEGSRPVRKIDITATVDELMGMNAYMDIRALNRLMNEDDVISGGYLMVDPLFEEDLYARLKRMPTVAGVGLPGAILKSFNETFAKTIGIFTFVLVLFSSAIVFGVVYNAARITLSERGRELASLRVLGFTKREIAVILLGEHAVLTVLAIPLGFGVGFVLCATMNNLVDNELMRLPLVFSRRTFLLTAVFVAAAAIVSGLLVAWRLRNLDLIAVLKTRE